MVHADEAQRRATPGKLGGDGVEGWPRGAIAGIDQHVQRPERRDIDEIGHGAGIFGARLREIAGLALPLGRPELARLRQRRQPGKIALGVKGGRAAPDQLQAETMALAQTVAGKLGAAVRIGKRAFYQQMQMPLDQAYAYTGGVMAENMLLRDTDEGISAFIEKRKPDWA